MRLLWDRWRRRRGIDFFKIVAVVGVGVVAVDVVVV